MSGPFALICFLLLGPQTIASESPGHVIEDRVAARAVLHDVLSQRAFAGARHESWSMGLHRRFEKWLTDLWARLLGSRFGRPSAARVVAWIVSIGAMCVLIAWLWRAARRNRHGDAFQLDAPAREERGWRMLAEQALDLIGTGRTREGARLAYRAAVQRLEDDGAFAHDATRTPREYLRLIPEQHRRRPALSTLTAAFERLWYGSRDASADEGREIVRILQELECLPREPAN